MTDRYALVANGVVANVILWDGQTGDDGWSVPAGMTAVALADDSSVGIGWAYDGSQWTAPPAPPQPPDPAPVDPVTKLTAFLTANPDVAKLVGA